VQGHDHPLLQSGGLNTSVVHWVAGTAPAFPARLTAKTRYRQADQACTVNDLDDGRVSVLFAQPQRAVTPGQSVVFYSDEVCLGGAVIEETF
jgi:tRNA-specific 2-thiouridylase